MLLRVVDCCWELSGVGGMLLRVGGMLLRVVESCELEGCC